MRDHGPWPHALCPAIRRKRPAGSARLPVGVVHGYRVQTLAGGFRESETARLEIGDAGVAAFRAVWHFLYTDDSARIADLRLPAELLEVLSLAERFELPAVEQACARRLSELVPDMAAEVLLVVLRAAKVHELRSLRAACHDRISETGGNFLLQDGVQEFLAANGEILRC